MGNCVFWFSYVRSLVFFFFLFSFLSVFFFMKALFVYWHLREMSRGIHLRSLPAVGDCRGIAFPHYLQVCLDVCVVNSGNLKAEGELPSLVGMC